MIAFSSVSKVLQIGDQGKTHSEKYDCILFFYRISSDQRIIRLEINYMTVTYFYLQASTSINRHSCHLVMR